MHNSWIVNQQVLNMHLEVKVLSLACQNVFSLIITSDIRTYIAIYLFGNGYVFKMAEFTFSRKRA